MTCHRFVLMLAVLLFAISVAHADDKPVLVVYDFTSDFDEGQMGKWIADMLRGHARRSKMYVTIDAITFADLMAGQEVKVTGSTSAEVVGKLTRDTFAGDIFIYGQVTRKGAEGYRLTFKAYHVDAKTFEKLLEESHDCPRKQFCSGAVDKVLKKLGGIEDIAEEWKKLADNLKGFAANWREKANADEHVADLAQAMKKWTDELTSSERKLTSYRMQEAAHREILDQFRKLVVDAGNSADALKEKGVQGLAGSRQVLVDADRIADNITTWLDTETPEGRWKTGANLVRNGDFTHGQDTPADWDPLPAGVTWVKHPKPKDKRDKCIRMDVNRKIAESYGMIYYSKPFAIEEGATYRFSVAAKTARPDLKVFIKCYQQFDEKWDFKAQAREVYRAPLHVYTPEDNKTGWNTYTRDFVPYTGNRNHPRFCRVMLYAYLRPGVVYWDDVVIKKIKDPPKRQ